MQRVKLDRLLIQDGGLGIVRLHHAFIAPIEKMLSLRPVWRIGRHVRRILPWRGSLILREMQHQRVSDIIGAFSRNAVLDQPPLKGVCEFRFLIKIELQRARLAVSTPQQLLHRTRGVALR